MESWWRPKPFVTEITRFEFRAGGVFACLSRMPKDAMEVADEELFLEIRPERRIVFTNALGEHWRPAGSTMLRTVEVDLIPADEGRNTFCRICALHADAQSMARDAALGFEFGWNIVLAQLEEAAQSLEVQEGADLEETPGAVSRLREILAE